MQDQVSPPLPLTADVESAWEVISISSTFIEDSHLVGQKAVGSFKQTQRPRHPHSSRLVRSSTMSVRLGPLTGTLTGTLSHQRQEPTGQNCIAIVSKCLALLLEPTTHSHVKTNLPMHKKKVLRRISNGSASSELV